MVLSDSELQELETKGSEPLWQEMKDGGLGRVWLCQKMRDFTGFAMVLPLFATVDGHDIKGRMIEEHISSYIHKPGYQLVGT